MSTILMFIKPEYVNKVFDGSKNMHIEKQNVKKNQIK